MPAHSLNTQRAGWEPGNFPPEISGWAASSTDKATVSSLHGTASRTVLNGYAAQAIIEYAKGELDPQSAKIALVDTGNGMTYSAEAAMADRRKMVVTMNRPDAKSNTITLRASILTPTSQGDYVYAPVPPLTADTEIQLAPIFVCLLAHLLHLSADAHDDLSTIFNGYVATSSFDSVELEFRRLCDALTGCLDSGFISISVPGNNIDMLVKQSVALRWLRRRNGFDGRSGVRAVWSELAKCPCIKSSRTSKGLSRWPGNCWPKRMQTMCYMA